MRGVKVAAFWVRPGGEASLPEAAGLVEALLAAFCEAFPEYDGALTFSQPPRAPRHLFVYASGGCNGLLPEAGEYLRGLLEHAFPGGEVRAYGRRWPARSA